MSIRFEQLQYNVSEEQAVVEVCVVLNGMIGVDVVISVDLIPNSGNATPDADFEFISTSITFTPTSSRTMCDTAMITGNDAIEDEETFSLSLTAVDDAVIVSINRTEVHIQDSSQTIVNLITGPDFSVIEGEGVMICFMSTEPLERDITVIINLSGSKSSFCY